MLDKQGRGEVGLGVAVQDQPSRHRVRPCCHPPAMQPWLPWLRVSTRDHHRGHLRPGVRISTNGRRLSPSGERFGPPGVAGGEGWGPPGCPTLGEGEGTEVLMSLTWPQPRPAPPLASWLRGGSPQLTWNVARFGSPDLLRGPKPGALCPGSLPGSICKGSSGPEAALLGRSCPPGASTPGEPEALGWRETPRRSEHLGTDDSV